MKFEIFVEETVSQGFVIEADTVEDALEIARKDYIDGEIVLEPGDLVSAIAIDSESNKQIEIV